MDWTDISSLYSGDEVDRIEKLRDKFHRIFGGEPRFFSAPGRVEIGGNHTDHQLGHVLAAAICLDAVAAAAPNGLDVIRIVSEGYGEIEVDLGDLAPRARERETSAGIVRGMAEYFTSRAGEIKGFDAVISSQVPAGSGLSSSAAFEVLIGTVMDRLFLGGKTSPEETAMAGQYAENTYFGKPCGLMDQMASAVGGVTAIDFHDPKSPAIRTIAVDFAPSGSVLCVIAVGSSHEDMTDEYAAIPAEMTAAAGLMGWEKLGLGDRDSFFKAIADLRGKISDRAILRAMHFFREDRRAVDEAEALEKGDFDRFLHVVNDSGRSSWALLQNICPAGAVWEQPVAMALMACRELLGDEGACRVHGGGFAGTVLAFVPAEKLSAFKTGIERITGEGSCVVLNVRNVGGVEVML